MLDMKDLMSDSEQLIWEGRPDKLVTILESIFNPMLPFAVFWGAADFFIFYKTVGTNTDGFPILLFLVFHAMPVWMYLGGVLTVALRVRNIYYLVTTGGVYVSGGLLVFNYQMKPWTDISHINIHRGVFDSMFGVGDIVFICSHSHMSSHDNHSGEGIKIKNIREFSEVFKLVKSLQTDIYADTMYPNAKRPDTNPGYKTRYNRY